MRLEALEGSLKDTEDRSQCLRHLRQSAGDKKSIAFDES